MENILAELYYDNVRPQEMSAPGDAACQKALNHLVDVETTLSSNLEGENLRLFNEYTNAFSELLANSEESKFIIGFRLGAHIIFDAFISEE